MALNLSQANGLLATALRDYRKRTGATYRELAAATGVSLPNISVLARGQMPSIRSLRKLGKFLGLAPTEIGMFVLFGAGVRSGRKQVKRAGKYVAPQQSRVSAAA